MAGLKPAPLACKKRKKQKQNSPSVCTKPLKSDSTKLMCCVPFCTVSNLG